MIIQMGEKSSSQMSSAETTGIHILYRVYPGRFGHAECRGGNQCNHCRADAFEYTFHNGVVLEVVKEQRYGEDDEKRRKYGSQCSDYAPSYFPVAGTL